MKFKAVVFSLVIIGAFTSCDDGIVQEKGVTPIADSLTTLVVDSVIVAPIDSLTAEVNDSVQ